MLLRSKATVLEISDCKTDAVKIVTEFGPAIAYSSLIGHVKVGERVLINLTANKLNLGTGGFDFVICRFDDSLQESSDDDGHIIKLRYTPLQHSVTTIEELLGADPIWDLDLEGFPVVVCQLHSQIAHVAAAASAYGKKSVYIMTDTASLPYSFSNLAHDLKTAGLISASITTGQAFGGDLEAVTVHSALLASKYYLNSDLAIVCQGPGNAGTGTKYGFSGIDQAGLLDIVAALSGLPIATVRYSETDSRIRHQGLSHHSSTTLRLVRSACTISLPPGMMDLSFDSRHRVVEVTGIQEAFDLLDSHKIKVSTMGRSTQDDRLFFEAAAAAGKFAASNGISK